MMAACSSPPPKTEQSVGEKPLPTAATPSTEVALKAVKWPELQAAIESHKGEVVVLDVWGEF